MTAATRSIVIRRVLPAPRARVFEAWCRPELMARWFVPSAAWRAEVTADVRPDGRFRVVLFEPGGGVHVHDGVYREVSPPARLVLTWTAAALGVADSLVTVELAEHGPRGELTELTLTHALPDLPGVVRAHEDGWTGCLGVLAAFIT
ncbi:MAG TPA: SRPBCC domain-containing protein [Kofleriaceae bacterium]|jgi:uncharacterized protein YndB with AHSA1/START domain|nr:SRPBCC domain-containing protein [Kofleriaceae bacterium]